MLYLNIRKKGDKGFDSSILHEKVSGSEHRMEQS